MKKLLALLATALCATAAPPPIQYNPVTTNKLASGSASQVLTWVSGVPSWASASGGGTGIATNSGTGTNNFFTTPTTTNEVLQGQPRIAQFSSIAGTSGSFLGVDSGGLVVDSASFGWNSLGIIGGDATFTGITDAGLIAIVGKQTNTSTITALSYTNRSATPLRFAYYDANGNLTNGIIGAGLVATTAGVLSTNGQTTAGGGSQTPWLQDIDGGVFNFSGSGTFSIGGLSVNGGDTVITASGINTVDKIIGSGGLDITGGGITNNADGFWGNGIGLTNLTSIASQVANTNFILNAVYRNTSGNIQMVRGSASLVTAAVSGRASLDVMVDQAGGTTFARGGGAAITTTVAVTLAQAYTNDFSAVISTNATYYLTNSSAGSGDASTLVSGSGQLATLGFGGPPGSAAPTTKVYRALLTQSGTAAPVATVLENTLGTVSYGYNSVGNYAVTATGLLTVDKTGIQFGDNSASFSSLGLNGFTIISWDLSTPTTDNNIFIREMLTILVYP